MVTKFVLRWMLTFACLISVTSLVKADTVNLSPLEVTLGEPVTLILKGKNIEKDFTKFDKSKIRQHFEIYDVEGDSDYMRLLLYPRREGNAEFPAMHIGKLQFEGVAVKVKPNEHVTIDWQEPKDEVYSNQLQSWKALVKTSDPSLGVRMLLHPHANDKVMHLYQQTPLKGDGKWLGGQRVFQMLIGSDQPVKVKVRTPIIEVQNTGNGRPWLFFDNTLWLHVKPLPSYLPVAIPVGKVSLQAEKLDFWQIQNQQLDWQLVLKGENLAPNSLPEISDQFAYNHSIEWLMSDQQKRQQWTSNGLTSERVIKQPLRFVALGLIRLPDMRITYFNPSSGKLEDQFISGQWVFSVPRAVYWLMNAIFYLLIVMGLLLLVWVFMDAWYKLRLIIAIKRAKDTEAVWKAIVSWSVTIFGKDAENLTFAQWQTMVEAYYGDLLNMNALVAALDKEHFSLSREDAQTLALAWAQALPMFNWQRIRMRLSALTSKFA